MPKPRTTETETDIARGLDALVAEQQRIACGTDNFAATSALIGLLCYRLMQLDDDDYGYAVDAMKPLLNLRTLNH